MGFSTALEKKQESESLSFVSKAIQEQVKREVEDEVKKCVAAAADSLHRRVPEIVAAVALTIASRLDMYSMDHVITIKFNDPSKKLEGG